LFIKGLVRRGVILLDLSILDGWDSELERMNSGKEGEQYVYPDVFTRLLGYIHVLLHLPRGRLKGY
jgi:hypothetical protein